MLNRSFGLMGLTMILQSSAFGQHAPLSSRERAFVSSCTSAFERSSGEATREVGAKICDCTIHESRHEGVSPKALKHETAEISKDPKYKIRDQKLLNAFHYCSIEILRGTGDLRR